MTALTSQMIDFVGGDPTARAMALAAKPVPVASGSRFPFQSGQAGAQQSYRTAHHFPRGGKAIQLLIASAYAGANENFTATGYPIKLAAAIEPGPWDPTKTYAIGDQVTYYGTAAGGMNPYFVAVAASTNSPPTPTNANWSQGARPVPTPITIRGSQEHVVTTQEVTADAFVGSISGSTLTVTSASNSKLAVGQIIYGAAAGTTITALGTGTGGAGTYTVSISQTLASQPLVAKTVTAVPLIITDPLPLTVPVGGWLAIWSWFPIYGAQVNTVALLGQNPTLGQMASLSTTSAVSDRTSNNNSAGSFTIGSGWRPAAIVGQPLGDGETSVLIGDSIGSGSTGTANVSSATVVSGGSGYKAGDILTIDNAGATAGAVAAGSDAKLIVDTIGAGGAIATMRVVDVGGYTNTASQTGQALPSGTQALIGGSGTGATASVTFGTNPYDAGNLLGGQGWAERALTEAGVPYVACVAPGDRVNLWRARSYSRLAAIAASNPSRAIIALGRNDLSQGDSAATIISNLQWLASALRGVGIKKVAICTVTGETSSTSAAGQSTLAAQSITANDTARQMLNATLRSSYVALGFDVLIDLAAVTEEGGVISPTGKFLPIGGRAAFADGKHPGLSALLAMTAEAVARLPALLAA